jgi:hypothetical protein
VIECTNARGASRSLEQALSIRVHLISRWNRCQALGTWDVGSCRGQLPGILKPGTCADNATMRNVARMRRLLRWGAWTLGAIVALLGLYLSVFFLPYPLFPHHAEFAGFSVYSDREIPQDLEFVFDDARRRVDAMELARDAALPRIFICRSQRLFAFLIRLAGKRHAGQGLLISAAGNSFLSETGIESVARRSGGRPAHSRLQGSWSAAVAHEVAHHVIYAELGFKRVRRIPAWKSEGYADYAANVASAMSDPDYDFQSRIRLLLDEEFWERPSGPVDRRHFRWHVIVEYLFAVKGLEFSELLDATVTEGSAWNEMMAWYRGSQTRQLSPS